MQLPSSRLFSILLIAVWVLAGLRLAGVAAFAFDSDNTTFAIHKERDFGIKHNCFTCLIVGAELVQKGTENPYAKAHYPHKNKEEKRVTETQTRIGDRFTIDHFPYAPPILLVPSTLRLFTTDFFALRTIWFVLSSALFLSTIFLLARWSGASGANSRLMWWPLLLLAPIFLVSLQIGNVHILVLSLSLLGLHASIKGHPVLAGALLALAIGTKIWPAALVVYLLFRGDRRTVLWSSICLLIYSLISVAWLGTEVWVAFFEHQVPALMNGESFAFMKSSNALLANTSVFGVVHKLHALGVIATEPDLLPKTLSWGTTIFIAGATIALGLRRRGTDDPLGEVRVWLALIALIQLRSPFLPWDYGQVITLALLIWLLPGAGRGRVVLSLILFAVVAIGPQIPGLGSDGRLIWALLVWAGIVTAILMTIISALLGRRLRKTL